MPNATTTSSKYSLIRRHATIFLYILAPILSVAYFMLLIHLTEITLSAVLYNSILETAFLLTGGVLWVLLCINPSSIFIHVLSSFPQTQQLFVDGHIHFKQLLIFGYFNVRPFFALEQEGVRQFFLDGHITWQQLQEINAVAINALEQEGVRQILIGRHITWQQLLEINAVATAALDGEGIRQLFIDRHITWQQLLEINPIATAALNHEGIRQVFIDRPIIWQQLQEINSVATVALYYEGMRQILIGRHITWQQLLEINFEAINALLQEDFRQYFIDGHITWQQLQGINHTANIALSHNVIRQFFINGHITWQQLQEINAVAITALEEEGIRQFYIDGRITWQQLLQMNNLVIAALLVDEIRQHIIDGDFTVQILINRPEMRFNNIAHPNLALSTHTESVHKTVSKSASNLLNRYPKAAKDKLESIITEIRQWAENLKDFSPQNRAAKRCIPRITQINYTFTDHKSQISTRQLLALAWTAMHDDSLRHGTLEDALKLFVSGLYEIQRGYNLDSNGIDTIPTSRDMHICSAGTFNKIMEKLVGIHPDVSLIFINKQTAALKLPKIVKEEARHYIVNLVKEKREKELNTLIKTLGEVREEGVSVIWENIKPQVSERMFDEFGNLFKARSDKKFIEFVANGIYAPIEGIVPDNDQLANLSSQPLLLSSPAKKHTVSNSETTPFHNSPVHADSAASMADQDTATLTTNTKRLHSL